VQRLPSTVQRLHDRGSARRQRAVAQVLQSQRPMSEIRTDIANGNKVARWGASADLSKDDYAKIKADFVASQGLNDDDKQWLRKQPGGLELEAALNSDLDYDGYVHTANHSLDITRQGGELDGEHGELHHDADRYQAGLDRLPSMGSFGDNGLPQSLGAGNYLGRDDNGQSVTAYQTGGGNTTKVVGDLKISDADASQARDAQKDFCTKMSARIGLDVANPPSVAAAKRYFQTMADGGASTSDIRREYDSYLKTFYRHPGGVDWSPPLDPKSSDFGDRIAAQPVAKDGRRLIDCEGFAALSENVLGGIRKNGQPMFDVKLASTSSHITCGVFPHGGDPRNGFVVDNANANPIPTDNISARDWAASPDADTRKRYLMRVYMQSAGEGMPADYGDTFSAMGPPPEKIKMQ
jgi:hypothetical protein